MLTSTPSWPLSGITGPSVIRIRIEGLRGEDLARLLVRKKETLDEFFEKHLSAFQRSAIRAACVDMWEPYRQSLEQWVPECRIIYDTENRCGLEGSVNGNIKALLRRGRGYRDMNYLLLKAQRLAATKTEFLVLQKAAQYAHLSRFLFRAFLTRSHRFYLGQHRERNLPF
jgi:Transposase